MTEFIVGMTEDEKTKLHKERNVLTGYLSCSAIDKFLSCPLRFKFAYIDGRKIPPGIPLVQGSVMHIFWEHHFKGLIPPGKELRAFIDEQFDIIRKAQGITVYEEDVEGAITDGKDELERTLGYYLEEKIENIPAPKIIDGKPAVELYFCKGLPRQGLKLHGFIDHISDPCRIIDYKTSGRRWNPHRESYELQSFIYPWALDEMTDPYSGNGPSMDYVLFYKHKKPKPDSFEVRSVLTERSQRYWFINETMTVICNQIRHGLDDPAALVPIPRKDDCHLCEFRQDCPVVPHVKMPISEAI